MSAWIACSDLVKIYRGSVKALDGIDLELSSKIVALIGPNGAGKTTFVRICTGLLKPTKGRIYVLGIDVVSNPFEVKKRIALLPQDVSPDSFQLPLSMVSTYLAIRGYSFSDARRRAKEILSELGLDNYMKTPCYRLSGGMRKLVLVAAILALEDVDALFLDEPTTGLDPVNSLKLWLSLEKRARDGINILVTSHNMSEVERYVDEVAMIDRGRIVVKDRPRDLVEKLSKEVVRVDMLGIDRRALERIEGIAKIVDLGEKVVVYVYRDSLHSIVSGALSRRWEFLVREKLCLEDVFLWYTH